MIARHAMGKGWQWRYLNGSSKSKGSSKGGKKLYRWSRSKQLPGEPKVTLKFGKHCGRTLEEIAALPDGLSYLEWIAHRAVPDKRGVTVQLQQLARRVYYQHCAQGRQQSP